MDFAKHQTDRGIATNRKFKRISNRVFEWAARLFQAHRQEMPSEPLANRSPSALLVAAIAKHGIEQDIGYIATGGGAFLQVLEGKALPASEILQKCAAG